MLCLVVPVWGSPVWCFPSALSSVTVREPFLALLNAGGGFLAVLTAHRMMKG